jgi:hypothetical protein
MFFINPFIYAGGGDFESIATVTVGSGGANTIEFTSIPSTYQHLQIRALVRSNYPSAQPALAMRINGTNIDRNHSLYGDGASATAYTGTGGNISHSTGGSASASMFSAIVVDVLDYTSTTKNKVVRAFSGGDRNGSGFVEIPSALEQTTSAITSIALLEPDTLYRFVQYSTAALYGVRA